MKKTRLFFLTLLAAALASCNPQDPYVPEEFSIEHGVFVLNEGNYTFGSSSLTFYDPEADTVINSLFKRVNFDLGQSLGDVAQSLAMADGMLYIVVNNSNYIYKMDANTIRIDTTHPFKLVDFYSPREMHFVAPNKAYVSDLYGTQLWIVNPQNMTHTGSIVMGKSTEKIVQVGRELYVSNWSKQFVQGMDNNTVQVVDINNDVKVAEITVGKEPNCLAVDKNNHVWVLCEGATWELDGENPTLWEIDPMLKTATKRYEFTGTAMIMKANVSGTGLYVFYNNEVRRFDIATSTLSENFSIAAPEGGMFYNMAVNPNNGDLYVTDAKNYMMNGSVYRYTEDGVLLSSFEVGIIPSAMLFK
jgi:DNA-binding beta-propeller fold protein YncE